MHMERSFSSQQQKQTDHLSTTSGLTKLVWNPTITSEYYFFTGISLFNFLKISTPNVSLKCRQFLLDIISIINTDLNISKFSSLA